MFFPELADDIQHDGVVVKSRHPGEGRGPALLQLFEKTGSESRKLAHLRPLPE